MNNLMHIHYLYMQLVHKLQEIIILEGYEYSLIILIYKLILQWKKDAIILQTRE